MAVLFRLLIFAFSVFSVPILAGKNLIVPSREAESAGVHAINAHDVGYLPEEEDGGSDRSKRATPMRSIFAPFQRPLNMTLDTEIVSSFDTTDRNDQMKLVYPGNGADLVFAFTYMLDYSKNFTSSLFLSRDSGRTFTDVTATLLKLPNGGGIGKVYSCLRTPASSQRYALVDVEHQVLFVTTDGFRNVLPRRTPFRSTDMSLDPRNPDVVFAREDYGKKPLLWVSMNFGLTWEVAEQYIDSVVVGSEGVDAALDGKSTLFALRAKPNGKFSVLRSESYFLNDKKTDFMIEDVEEFEMAGDFLFATKRESSAKNAGLKLWMSYQRKPFQLANFGTDKPVVDYFVTNVTKFGQAVIAVTFDDKRTDVYFCAPNSTNFTKSLDNVLFFHPQQGIGRFSILKAMWNNSKPFSEIYRVKGLHGVYIASQLVVDDATSYMGNSVTKITYDNGATWKVIRAPPMDVNRELIKCAVGHACPTLHFTQKFPLFASARNQQTFFSSHHAPGLIIGAGVIGENTADAGGTTNAIFITTDGGHRWRETLKGVYHFAVGDHGGLIVAVNAAGRTQELLYTTDEGANWKGVKIADQRVRILSVLTEPGERQTVFSLFGTLKNESDLRHEWVIITVNLTSVFNGTKCGPTDFKPWTFRPASIGHRCHMGQKVWYTRRAVNRKCLVGRDFQRNVTIENCPCQYYDFECDLGYVPLNNSTILTCVKDPGSTYDPIVLPAGAVCPPGGSWLRSRKFRKIPMNTCEGGVSKRYSPEKVPCAWPGNDDFLILAADNVVQRFELIRFPQNMSDLTDMLEVLGSRVTGLDYDHRDKCLFLSEVQRGRIRRICFNGYTSQSILAQQYVDYPVAISFDWMSRNLYWLDRKRGTIEAVNVDSTVDGRMRTIILKDMNLLTEATDFIVFPPAGVMFWTFIHPADNNSVIYQARLDGTQIRKLTEPRYPRQPDALSFDYHRGKLMYIDHTTFDIGEVTFSSAPDGWDSAIVLRRNQRNRMKFAAFYKNRIYYTAFNHDQLFMTTRGASSSQMMMHVGGNVNVIKAFAPSMQPGSGSWLKNITCHTLRVTMPANETACLCPEGFVTDGTRCLCPDRTLPSTHQDGRCPAFGGNCSKAQFSCGAIGRTQSMCIPKVWRCDGENDCGNNLDEEDCENTEDSCNPDYHFRCGDGTCIYKDWQCDGGGPDCSDGSDERNCPLTKPCSRADYVRCNISNDQCIPKGWWCDSEEDCDDGSDELHCGYMTNFSSTACNPSTEFECASDSACVKKEYKCDGDSNCADGSDEIHCPLHNCSTWEFSCANGNCTYTNYICDGMNDCGDNSDELNCTNIVDHRATFNCSFKDGDAMDCGDGLCVPLTWKCDGLLDCPNGLDEQGCHESRFEACGPNTTNCLSNGKCVNLSATCDGKEDCPGGEDEHNCPCAAKEFTCGDGVKCIPQSYVCDENLDCPGGEDEGSICDNRPKCDPTQFRCRFSGKCVPLMRACNSVNDCPHGEDEFGCANAGDLNATLLICTDPTDFPCATGLQCISRTKRCNQKPDCADASDEDGCPNFDTVGAVKSVDVNRTALTPNSSLIFWTVDGDSSSNKSAKSENYTVRYGAYQTPEDRRLFEAGDGKWGSNFTTTNKYFNIRSLVPYTIYRALVRRSASVAKTGTKDPMVTFTTLMDKPTRPLKVRLSQTLQDSLSMRVEWDPPQHPNGPIRSYDVIASNPPHTMHTRVGPRQGYTVLKDLQPNVNYTVTVTAITGELDSQTYLYGEPSEPQWLVVGKGAITAPIRELTVKSKNNTCVAMVWTKPNTEVDVLGYVVDRADDDRPPNWSPGTRIDVCDLRPGTAYQFYIRAQNNASQGPAAEIDVTTTGQLILPPHSLKVSRSEGTVVTLTWLPSPNVMTKSSAPISYGIYYGLSLREIRDNGKPLMTVNDSLTATITNLLPCRDYIFRVRIDGPTLHSNFSSAITSHVFSDLTLPPTNIRVSKTGVPGKVMISWDPSCGVAELAAQQPSRPLNYWIRLRHRTKPSESPPLLGATVFGSYNNYTTEVRKASQYIVEVTYAGAANAQQSAPVTFSTGSYESPVQFTAFQHDNGSYVLSWALPKSLKKHRDSGAEFDFRVSAVRLDDSNKTESVYTVKDCGAALQLRPAVGKFLLKVAAVDQQESVGEWSPVVTVIGTNELLEPSEQSSSRAGIVIPIILLIIACPVIFLLVRRYQRRKRSNSSFTTTRFHNTPYGNEFHDLDMEDEDMPVFRAFADDEPLVNT